LLKTNAAVQELVTWSSTGLIISAPGVIGAAGAGAACAGLPPTSASAATATPSTVRRRRATDHSRTVEERAERRSTSRPAPFMSRDGVTGPHCRRTGPSGRLDELPGPTAHVLGRAIDREDCTVGRPDRVRRGDAQLLAAASARRDDRGRRAVPGPAERDGPDVGGHHRVRRW